MNKVSFRLVKFLRFKNCRKIKIAIVLDVVCLLVFNRKSAETAVQPDDTFKQVLSELTAY